VAGVDDLLDDGDLAYAIVTAPAVSDDPAYSGLDPSDVLATNLDDDASPVLTLPGAVMEYGIGQTGVGIDGGALVEDDVLAFDNGSLTVTLAANGTADDRLGIRNEGTGAGQVGVTGTDVTYGGTVIGSLAGGVGIDPLVVAFNSNATLAGVQAVTRAVTFWNVSDGPSTLPRTVEFVVTDRGGNPSNVAAKSIQIAWKRVTEFREGVDSGFASYTGVADIELVQAQPNTAFPTGVAAWEGLLVDWPDADNGCQVLLRFDQLIGSGPGQIPVGAKILSADLVVDVNNDGAGAKLHRLLTPWDVDTETWNSFANGVAPRNTTGGVQADDAEARTAYDSQIGVAALNGATGIVPTQIGVTADVQAWADGQANYGWAFLPWPNGTDGWAFSPSEATNPADRPLLRVEWLPPDAGEVSFQQGVGGYTGTVDTQVQQNAASTNYATAPTLWSDADAGAQSQILLRFENLAGSAAGQIPLGSTIHAAVLRLAATESYGTGDGGKFHPLLVPWSATDTWSTLVGGVQANDVEARAADAVQAGNAALIPNAQGGWTDFDVTADVQAWLDGSLTNYGWAILPWSGGGDGWGISSSDHSVPMERPLLRIYLGQDYGDAPSSYGTATAWHGDTGPTLGTDRDTEDAPAAPLDGTGDDVTGTPDDEDGLVSLSAMAPSGSARAVVDVQGVTGTHYLNAWIDFNRDGDFGEADEQIATDVPVTANGHQAVIFTIPATAVPGASYARFRLNSTSGLDATVAASDGEIEDYAVTIEVPPTPVYVDDTWAGTTVGTNPLNDPVGGLVFGYNAFSDLPSALPVVATGGTVTVFGGTYPASVTIDRSLAAIEVDTNSTPPTETTVDISGPVIVDVDIVFRLQGATNLTFGAAVNAGADAAGETLTIVAAAPIGDEGTLTFGGGGGGGVTALAAIDATAGVIDLKATLTAIGTVTLTATNGAIVDGNAAPVTITAAAAVLSAATSIGASGAPLALSVAALTTASGGPQFLSEADTLTVGAGDLSAGSAAVTLSGGRFLTAIGGDILSPVVVASGAILGGTGTITGTVSAAGGSSIVPGLGPGILSTGAVSFNSGSNLDVELNGTALGAQYDQLNVAGTVSPGGAALNVTLGFTPAVGSAFTILNNDDDDGVTGVFNGLPEGKVFSVTTGSYSATFQITYQGGDGNDVVLTALDTSAPTLEGTPGGDYFVVRKNGPEVQVYQGTAPNPTTMVYSALLSGLTTLTIAGAGGDDTTTVDFSGGNPIPSGGLNFQGGNEATATGDVLNITGNAAPFQTFTVNHTGSDTDGYQGNIVIDDGSVTRTITFTGLEPINAGDATDIEFNLPGTDDVMTLADAGGGQFTLNVTSGTAETVTMNYPTAGGSLTVNLGDGNDSLTVTNTLLFNANTDLIIDGQGSTTGDTVSLNAASGFTVTDALSITAETINQTGPVTVSGTTMLNNQGSATAITLTNGGNNFSTVAVTATAAGVSLRDANNIDLGDCTVANLGVTASGAITDSGDISVSHGATFGGAAITLGESGETTNFGSLAFASGGAVWIAEDSDTEILPGAAGTLVLSSAGAVTDADGIGVLFVTTDATIRGTSITLGDDSEIFDVGGTASFDATAGSISVGTDSFWTVFGSLTFSTTGPVTIREQDDTDLVGANTAGTLNLTSFGAISDGSSGTDISVTGNASFYAAFAISIGGDGGETTHFGSLDATVVSTVRTVTIIEDSQMNLNAVSGTTVTLRSETGAIVDNNGPSTNISATFAALTAVGGIGDGTVLETAVTNLAFWNTSGGDVEITNSGALTIAAIGTLPTSYSAGGVTITAGSPITFAVNTSSVSTATYTSNDDNGAGLDNITVNSNVTVEVTGANQDLIFQSGDQIIINTNATVRSTGSGGNVVLESGYNDADNDGSMTLDGTVSAASTITLDLNDEAGAGTQTAGSITATNLQLLSGTGGGSFALSAGTNDVGTIAAASDGSIAYRDTNALIVGTVSTAGITTSNDDVTLCAASFSLTQNISAGAGTVRLSASSGGITQTGGAITASALGVAAGTNVSLPNANDVDTFAASLGGALSFADSDGFTIGSVASLWCFPGATGITGATDVELCTGGNLNITTALNASGTVRLNTSSGNITQSGTGVITAANVGARASGNVDLNTLANAVSGTFAARSNMGVVEFQNNQGFAVGTITAGASCFPATAGATTANGNIDLDANAGNLTVNNVVTAGAAGTVKLNADLGAVNLNATVSSTTGQIDITADSVNQNAGGNISTGSSAAINVTADNGNITMASGTTTTSSTGQIAYRARNNIALSTLTSSGATIVVTADSDGGGGGAISDNLNGELDDVTARFNIVGLQTALRAGSGIGSDALGGLLDLDLQVTNVAALTKSGDIHLRNSGALNIETVDLLSGVKIDNSDGSPTTGDDIIISATSPVTITDLDPVVNNDGGNIVFAAEGNADGDDLTINADITVTNGDAALDGDGNIILIAGDSVITQASPARVISTDNAGQVFLLAGTDFNNFPSTGAILNGSAGGDVVMGDGSQVRTDDGVVGLAAPDDVLLSIVNANADSDTALGDVVVEADFFGVEGTFANGTGAISDNLTGEAANVIAGSAIFLGCGNAASNGTGIGDDAAADNDIDTQISNLAALTERGDIAIDNTGALTIGNGSGGAVSISLPGLPNAPTYTLSGVTIVDDPSVNDADDSGTDNIWITASSPVTVDAGNPVVNNDGGNITLGAEGTGVGDDLTLYDNVRVTGGDGAIDGDGNIYLYAGDTIDLAAATVLVSVDASGTVLLSAGCDYNNNAPQDGNSGGDVS
ncbi:MAG TPA: DNRLRE domain-containing protein, partial [Candidatus Anammoximicrobium sp.]|nr:DNRLRE domain-containing protein [Candidatus Anammoximicrobium sp.]